VENRSPRASLVNPSGAWESGGNGAAALLFALAAVVCDSVAPSQLDSE